MSLLTPSIDHKDTPTNSDDDLLLTLEKNANGETIIHMKGVAHEMDLFDIFKVTVEAVNDMPTLVGTLNGASEPTHLRNISDIPEDFEERIYSIRSTDVDCMLDETVEQIHQPLTDPQHCVRTFQAPTINDNRLVVAFSDIDYDAEKGAQASNGNRVATAKLKLTSKENYNGLLQLVFGIANPIPTAHILTRDITIVPVNDAPYDINDIAHESIDEPEEKTRFHG